MTLELPWGLPHLAPLHLTPFSGHTATGLGENMPQMQKRTHLTSKFKGGAYKREPPEPGSFSQPTKYSVTEEQRGAQRLMLMVEPSQGSLTSGGRGGNEAFV